MASKFAPFLLVGLVALAGCNSADTLELVSVANKVEQPLPPKIQAKMRALGMAQTSPIMMRIFKEEGVLEVWKANAQNRFQLIADYNICAWSGKLGPKKREGDRQAPEGFYNVYPSQMNPQSSYYLSFNMGYPNKYDRAYGRSGTNLMVHGACSSAGCYSMTDAQVLQIYAFARDAFKGGQQAFQVQALPFRMSAENMARHRFSEHYEFWKMIKVGYDHFELTRRPPVVDVCEKKYVFNQVATEGEGFSPSGVCPTTETPPALTMAYSSYSKSFQSAFEVASRRFDRNDYIEPSEIERKAMASSGRQTKSPFVRPVPQTTYVLVGPNAPKPVIAQTPMVATTTTAMSVRPTSIANTETAQIPVPAANPNPAAIGPQDPLKKKKPFWQVW